MKVEVYHAEQMTISFCRVRVQGIVKLQLELLFICLSENHFVECIRNCIGNLEVVKGVHMVGTTLI